MLGELLDFLGFLDHVEREDEFGIVVFQLLFEIIHDFRESRDVLLDVFLLGRKDIVGIEFGSRVIILLLLTKGIISPAAREHGPGPLRGLRATEARRHVREEVPFHTGRRVGWAEALEVLR